MFRLFFLLFFSLSPLWADCSLRTESEGQTSVALKDFGLSQWGWLNCRPTGSRFGYGVNFRYLNFLTTERVEVTASGTLYLGKGFVNINPGRTTDGRWTTSIVGGYKLPLGISAVALVDPKWHHRADLPTTIFKKLWVCRGWLCGRVDDFHVGKAHAYHYEGIEARWRPVKHVELFAAPQLSILGTKKSVVAEFGLRMDFKLFKSKLKADY